MMRVRCAGPGRTASRLIAVGAVSIALLAGCGSGSSGRRPVVIYWAESPTGTTSEVGSIAKADGSGSAVDHNFVAGTTGGGGVAIDTRHVYWVNVGSGTIGRADLDGSHVNQRFITGAEDPIGIAVDAQHIYWTNSTYSRQDNAFENTIGRANLDGSHVDQRFIIATRGEGDDIAGLAVNSTHIYWADVASGTIGRADLNGTHVDRRFITEANAPDAVAVTSTYLYWTNSGDDTIGRADLDGSRVYQHCVEPTAVPIGNELEAVATDGQHLYWTDYPGDEIGRANLDGTDLTSRLIAADGVPEGIAISGRPITTPASVGKSGCASSPDPVLLGTRLADMGPFAVGWGEAAPPTLSNGGASASGTISNITWSSWGGPIAQGQGLNPLLNANGPGYYPKPAVMQLRLSNIRRCTPGSPLSYTTLTTREQTVPGGAFGPWQVDDKDLCRGWGI